MEEIVTNNTTQSFSAALLDCAQTAHYLSLSESYIRKAVCSNRIPFVRIGTRTLFRPSDLDKWISEHVVSTDDDINTRSEQITASTMLRSRRSRKAVQK